MTDIDILTHALCRFYGFSHAVLVGRARSGLVALSDVLGLAGKVAVIPSNICPVVVAALDAAGVTLRLAPVDAVSGLAEDDQIVATMSASPQAGMVMPTHLYGKLATYRDSCALAARAGWFVLENDTLCAARVMTGERRAFGDALLTSFGYAKTASAGSGGAIVTDDAALAAELRRAVASWPTLDSKAAAVEQSLMLVRRHLRLLGCPGLGQGMLAVEQQHLRHSFPPALAPTVLSALEQVPLTLERRAMVAERWGKALERFSQHLATSAVPVTAPWRLIRSVTMPSLRDPLVHALREQGVDAGTNFPSLTESFPDLLGGQKSLQADSWSASVVNLWLDDAYTPERIQSAMNIVQRVFHERELTNVPCQ